MTDIIHINLGVYRSIFLNVAIWLRKEIGRGKRANMPRLLIFLCIFLGFLGRRFTCKNTQFFYIDFLDPFPIKYQHNRLIEELLYFLEHPNDKPPDHPWKWVKSKDRERKREKEDRKLQRHLVWRTQSLTWIQPRKIFVNSHYPIFVVGFKLGYIE